MTQTQLAFVCNQKAAHEHMGQKRLREICLRRRLRLVNISAAGQGDAQQHAPNVFSLIVTPALFS